MQSVFDSYIENAMGEEEQADFKFRQFEYNYKKYFPLNNNLNVLDIGIGRGEMLSCMKNWGYENYLGIDISPSTVKFCKKIGLNCELVNDTTQWLRDHKNTFSLVTLIDVLEHIPKPDIINFLQSILESLTGNGLLITQTPNMGSPDPALHRYNDITHEFGFVEHSLRQVLIIAGFRDFKFDGFQELLPDNLKHRFLLFIRSVYWSYIKLTRKINGSPNSNVLNPVFYCIAKK
jgi:2-polyprenyl-3-methyl-5-hydroxy-6-metoxy-1,4-benzoquinol methylase